MTVEASRFSESVAVDDANVDLRAADLDLGEAEISELYAVLADDEREKAGRFHFRRDRDRYVAARGILRRVLARHLAAAPEHIRFAYGPYGKPYLEAPRSSEDLDFNVSHSGGLAVFAVGRNPMGVDVEAVRELSDMLPIAERFFSQDEVRDLRAIPAAERAAAFFRCWTAKEAYIKARGEGLSMPLDRFAVSLLPLEGTVDLRVFDVPEKARSFRLTRFSPRAGYVAALAVAAEDPLPDSRRRPSS